MKITKKHLGEITEDLLAVLEREGISSVKEFTKKRAQQFSASGKAYITIEQRPSKLGSKTYTISYIIQGTGIPIEARINSFLNYSMIIIKSTSKFPDYSHFATDPFGNIAQEKIIRDTNFEIVKTELEKLKEYAKT